MQVLEAAAFTDVRILAGGLRAWEAEADEAEALMDEAERRGDAQGALAAPPAVPPLIIEEDGEGGLGGAWV